MARIQGNKILILEPVNFATDQDVILSESFPVLEEVSQVLKTHPEIQRILIEGHTDSRAGEAYNLDLSKRRAASVRTYLQESGVEPERLCSPGLRPEPPGGGERHGRGHGAQPARRVHHPPAAGRGRATLPWRPRGEVHQEAKRQDPYLKGDIAP